MEDEKPQTLDLNDTLRTEEPTIQAEQERTVSPSADDIIIQVEEDNATQEPTNNTHSAFSWIRRK